MAGELIHPGIPDNTSEENIQRTVGPLFKKNKCSDLLRMPSLEAKELQNIINLL
jgi:hypothetical protein